MQPQVNSFRYYHLKISAKKLPGRGLRLDPLAVIFTGSTGSWQEYGRTECRENEWNPKFAQVITMAADSDAQRRVGLRIDFYNKQMTDELFLGTCEVNFQSLILANGQKVELELKTPNGMGSPRVFLTALEGVIGGGEGNVNVSFQMMQTNYFGVSMKTFYEISRAGGEDWYPVYKSNNITIDEQGYGQFPDAKMALRDMTAGDENAMMLVSLYRYKMLGMRRLLGYFRFTVKELIRKQTGDHILFEANTREDIVSGAVQVLYNKKEGTDYVFSFKLINVVWKATQLTAENVH